MHRNLVPAIGGAFVLATALTSPAMAQDQAAPPPVQALGNQPPADPAAQDQAAQNQAAQNQAAQDQAPQDQAPGQDLTLSGVGDPAKPPPYNLSPAELDQLLAPIALYPDALLGQILMASTYPLEVVEADRWRQLPSHAALAGPRLAAEVNDETWDPSVKSLVEVPRVLRMMDLNIAWTERLGEAFLADQGAVMDTVQRLRRRAQSAGTFRGNADKVGEESPSGGAPVIVIEQPTPDTIDVPVYDPWNAYGVWPDPVYPPDYYPAAFDGIPIADDGFGWFGVPVVFALWGWDRLDWGKREIAIDPPRWAVLDHSQRPAGGDVWRHSPLHRMGVAYRDPALQGRFPRVTRQSDVAAAPAEPRYFAPTPGAESHGVRVVRPRPSQQRVAAVPQAQYGSVAARAAAPAHPRTYVAAPPATMHAPPRPAPAPAQPHAGFSAAGRPGER